MRSSRARWYSRCKRLRSFRVRRSRLQALEVRFGLGQFRLDPCLGRILVGNFLATGALSSIVSAALVSAICLLDFPNRLVAGLVLAQQFPSLKLETE